MKPRSRSLKLSIVEKAATLESNGFRFWIGPCLIGLVVFWSHLQRPKVTESHFSYYSNAMSIHPWSITVSKFTSINIALCVSWIRKRKSTLKTLIFCGRQGLCLMIFVGFRSNQHELNIISSHFWCFWNATSITVSNFVARRPISRCVHVYWVTIDSLPVRCIHTA